ncbi:MULTISPECIES: hypothetical protein [Pseudoalteromonas]|uniref:hypothetical protein n=1 Tax=Pseudoalteromonas TaxID=53246 RepID=UPI00168031F8|nr:MULTISPECIES: hypothetical protein [Pseudoalteromonas]MBD1584008.1 hypothetical protein [Pseudoalteromonas sp. S16_S37]MBR8843873.1 hypothetical protein [Pseudoalteromonas sp. JC3]UDM60732.1 hypothetical protein KIJ96_13015 [Pseudoalteromonas piscicida]WJE08128.1 hypothetical protein QSH61_14720 [Pseudoalteromonas sp. JC3]
MTALGLVKDILDNMEPVIKSGKITEYGYALFTVSENNETIQCCVSGMEYHMFGDQCYWMNGVYVATGKSASAAIKAFQSTLKREDNGTCSSGSTL